MKTIAGSLVVCILFLTSTVNATVWRVNNNTGIDTDFTTLSSAIAGASAGDTIYIEGSPNSYGADTVDKSLVIIGTGYFLLDNDSTQANVNSSKFDQLIIVASNTVVQGLHCVKNTGGHRIEIHADNVTIKRCHFRYSSYNAQGSFIYVSSNRNGIVIKQNFLKSDYQGGYLGNDAPGCIYVGSNSSIVIENNFIERYHNGGTLWKVAIGFEGNVSANNTIRNNIISGPIYIQNTSNFVNNIYRYGVVNGNFSGAYNMCDGTQLSGPGTIQNANMNSIFVNNGGTVDHDYMLACPGGLDDGCGDGEFGHDMGMFGGPSPYKLSGLPDIPAIFQFGGTGSASDNVPLQINIKAKSHN